MTDIICPECKHSIKNHFEDYDGVGRCMECQNLYPDNPDDPDCDNILKWCMERPDNLKLNMAIELLDVLVKFYIANPNSEYEFISCITPRKHSDSVWVAWDNARDFLAEVK